jgi:hypothetical protein
MRSIPFRHWYPTMLRETGTIETKSMGNVYVGQFMKWKIDSAKKKLRSVRNG